MTREPEKLNETNPRNKIHIVSLLEQCGHASGSVNTFDLALRVIKDSTLKNILFAVRNIQINLIYASFTQSLSRMSKGTTIRADIINDQDILAAQIDIRLDLEVVGHLTHENIC